MDEEKALARSDPDLSSAPFTYKTLQVIATTDFVPKPLRGNVPAILACVMAGREWGLGPMESLSRIDMIDGRPSPSGELLVARVFAAGHEIYPKDLSDKSATAVGIRHLPDSTPRTQEFTFTWEMAQRAGLTGKSNWRNYPEAMLYWRAAAQLVRFMFPDVLTSFKAYTPDELGSSDWVPPDPSEEGPQKSEAPEPEFCGAEGGADDATAVVGEILEGEVVPVTEPPTPPAPQDAPKDDEVFFVEELVGFVTKWLHGDEKAARMEVKRVQGRKKMTRVLARDLYAQLRQRLVTAAEIAESEVGEQAKRGE